MKRRARRRATRHNVAYTVATRPTPVATVAEHPQGPNSSEIELLLMDSIEEWCDAQAGQDLDSIEIVADDIEESSLIELQYPQIHEVEFGGGFTFESDDSSANLQEFAVKAEATLAVSGLLTKGLASGLSVNHQLVRVIDPDRNALYAAVVLTQMFDLDLEFTAIVDLTEQSVDEFFVEDISWRERA